MKRKVKIYRFLRIYVKIKNCKTATRGVKYCLKINRKEKSEEIPKLTNRIPQHLSVPIPIGS